MDTVALAQRLKGYEVTAVPAGSPALRLVWSAPEGASALVDSEAVAGADGAGVDLRSAGAVAGADDAEILPLLAAYRITRVPLHAAS